MFKFKFRCPTLFPGRQGRSYCWRWWWHCRHQCLQEIVSNFSVVPRNRSSSMSRVPISYLIHITNHWILGAFKGSIFVTRNAREYLESGWFRHRSSPPPDLYDVADHLRDTKFEADILQITDKFDQSTKLRFVGPDEAQFIRFGRWSDSAPELNIRAGQLKLPG